MFGWLRRWWHGTEDIEDSASWYSPVARPYAVGPGAPVSAVNPHPPVPPVQMPAVGSDGRWGTRDHDRPYVYGTAAYKRAEARSLCGGCGSACTWPRCIDLTD